MANKIINLVKYGIKKPSKWPNVAAGVIRVLSVLSKEANYIEVLHGEEYGHTGLGHVLKIQGINGLIYAHTHGKEDISKIIELPDEFIGMEVLNPFHPSALEKWDYINWQRVKRGLKLLWGFGVDDTHTILDLWRYCILVENGDWREKNN